MWRFRAGFGQGHLCERKLGVRKFALPNGFRGPIVLSIAVFISHVQLHDVPPAKSFKAYANLHVSMAREHFLLTIIMDGEEYYFRGATYSFSQPDYEDVVTVDGLAMLGANHVGYKCWTLTVKAESLDDIGWRDLPTVDFTR